MNSPQVYTTGFVTSKDGTTIGYRQMGHGPALILVHGGMQASQNFMKLAAALSNEFTVVVPDRRGRGLSGPHGNHYSLAVECEDIQAISQKMGAHNLFGLSSGALVALQVASSLPAIHRLVLYEPPLSVNHSTPIDWLARYDREVEEGKFGSAMLTVINGTQTAPPLFRFMPRFLLAPLLNRATKIGSEDKDTNRDSRPDRKSLLRVALFFLLWPMRKIASKSEPPDNKVAKPDDVPLKALVPTMHYDAQLVIESEGTLEKFKDVSADVLLLGGSQSPRYLKQTLDALEKVLPHVMRVELAGADHVAADNGGQPERVAQELRRFFHGDTATN